MGLTFCEAVDTDLQRERLCFISCKILYECGISSITIIDQAAHIAIRLNIELSHIEKYIVVRYKYLSFLVYFENLKNRLHCFESKLPEMIAEL